MIPIVVATEVRLYPDGIVEALAREPNLEVVATAATAEQCLERVSALSPGVVLFDYAMPAGLDAVWGLVRAETVRVVALAVPERREDAVACAEARVSGSVTRAASLDELVAAVEAAGPSELLCSRLDRRRLPPSGGGRGRRRAVGRFSARRKQIP